MKTYVLVVFIIYMISMIAIGFVFYRKKMSVGEYFLGGRQLNPWVTAMSAQASDMSGWLLTGIPGLAYASIVGAKEAIWTSIGLGIGTLLNWIIVAKRLRIYTEISNNSLTIPAYLENRFKEKKGIINFVAAIVILFFFTIYTASMFSAGAKLFSNVFSLNYTVALFIGAIVIVVYTFMGGFLAVSWTDLFQGLLMFFCLMFIPLFMLGSFNDTQSSEVSTIMGSIIKLFPTGDEYNYGMLGIISALGWGLGYCGMPHILTRFMACKDKRTIKPAAIIAIVWVFLSMFGAILIGIFGGVIIENIADKEQIFMEVVKNSFSPIVAGIMLSAILAAIMSTADSQLLVASSAFANDIFKKILKKDASEKQTMLVSRITLLSVAIVAFLLAMDENSSVFKVVSYAWAGLGASFGPVILFSLYSKKLTSKGAIASIASGAIVTILFKYWLSRYGGIWAIYELIPGFIISTIVLFVVSIIDKNGVTPEMEKEFDMMVEYSKSVEISADNCVNNIDNIIEKSSKAHREDVAIDNLVNELTSDNNDSFTAVAAIIASDISANSTTDSSDEE